MTDLLLATLVRATPLLVTGLAVLIAFRAGIWNIGAEGQFYAGAIVATWIGTRWGVTSPLAAALLITTMAAVAGAAWAAAPAWLRWRYGVLEVITTIMLNFIAEYLVSWLVQGPLQEAGRTYPQSDPLAGAARLAPLVGGTRVTLALPLALVLAGAVWLFLMRTRPGFQLRAAGAGPIAARVSGRINVGRVTTLALLVSGALAALAGAAEVCGVTFALYERLSPGYGYSAIAVALLARLNPLALIPAALFFGFLEAGASALQRSAGIPSVTVYAVEGLVILLVVAMERRLRSSDD